MTYALNEFLGGSYNNLQIKEEVNLLVKILLFRITREKFGGINFFVFEEIGLFWLNYRKRVFFSSSIYLRETFFNEKVGNQRI